MATTREQTSSPPTLPTRAPPRSSLKRNSCVGLAPVAPLSPPPRSSLRRNKSPAPTCPPRPIEADVALKRTSPLIRRAVPKKGTKDEPTKDESVCKVMRSISNPSRLVGSVSSTPPIAKKKIVIKASDDTAAIDTTQNHTISFKEEPTYVPKKRNDAANTSPFRTLKRLLQKTIDALAIDDISRARIEEAIFTSPGMLSLRSMKSITFKQEQELLNIIAIISQMQQLPVE